MANRLTAQRCPVCEGSCLVSRPAHVAAGQPSWDDTTSGPYPCRACNGHGYLLIGNVSDGRTNVVVIP